MLDPQNLEFSKSELSKIKKIKDPSLRLSFAVLLKSLQVNGVFPAKKKDVNPSFIVGKAEDLELGPRLWNNVDLKGRSVESQRRDIKRMTGFKNSTLSDQRKIKNLAIKELQVGLDNTRILVFLKQKFHERKLILPSTKTIEEMASAIEFKLEESFFKLVLKSLPKKSRNKVDSLISGDEILSLANLKQDPGKIGIKTLQREAQKMQVLKSIGLPDDLFENVSKPYLSKLKSRLASESLYEVKRHPDSIKYALMGVFVHIRIGEITDALVDLLIQLIHKIGVRAENRVTKELVNSFKKTRNLDGVFQSVLEASISNPTGVVKETIFPVVGGEVAIKNIISELKSSGPIYKIKVQSTMRASYVHHYRQLVPIIFSALEFKSNNTKHRPVIKGIKLVKKYRASKKQTYPDFKEVPIKGVVRSDLLSFVVQGNSINRANYELALLETLRSRLRCKEIWVDGGSKYGNPDEDLPQDFSTKRKQYIEDLGLDSSAKVFAAKLEKNLRSALEMLNSNIPENPKVKIVPKKGGRISLTPFEAQTEPQSLETLKKEIMRKWPMTGLLDMLKEAELRIGFSKCFETFGVREAMGKEKLQKRLMLTLFGLGTNMGLKRVCTTTTGDKPQDLGYIKRKYISRENLRNAIAMVANATMKIRMKELWRDSTTACASDSKKFGSWDQNLLTEWHIRYRGRGVMIYWHVDKKSLCVYSQLKSCSSSEVSSMIQGLLSHNTDAEIEKNYVDSGGQSEVGFAFCHLLGFQLMPRLKAINVQKLSIPNKGEAKNFPELKHVLTWPIKWDRIINQYDEMIKHVAALKLGYADAETILKRFTRNNLKHPTYLAFKELGKVIKTIFLCEYLASEQIRQEVNEGLTVVENWNSANSFIFFGKNSEISTNNLAEQEKSVLSLHLLQICMIYVNTIMVQQVVKENKWIQRLSIEDLRALNPLIYVHVNPYGVINLDMNERLDLAA